MRKILMLMLGSLLLFSCGNPSQVSFQDLSLESLEGEQVDLQAYAGKKVFLNFWATWCGPCRAELPSMARAQQLLGDEYVFLLVSDESPPTLQQFRDQTSFPFTYLHKPTSIKLLGIFSIPQTYLLNARGEVVKAYAGAQNWSSPEMIQVLRELE
jgi:thiol-disulfide isomerase/thioredoxin